MGKSVYLEYSKLDTFIHNTLRYTIIPSLSALASNVNGKNKRHGENAFFYPSTFTTTAVSNLNLTTPHREMWSLHPRDPF